MLGEGTCAGASCCIIISGRIYQNTQRPFLPTCSTSPPSARSGARADVPGSVTWMNTRFPWQRSRPWLWWNLSTSRTVSDRNASGRATWKRRVSTTGNQWESEKRNPTPCSHVLCNPMEGRAPSTFLKSSGVKRAGLPPFPPLLAQLLSDGWVSGPGILPPVLSMSRLCRDQQVPHAHRWSLSPRRGFTCPLRSGVDKSSACAFKCLRYSGA